MKLAIALVLQACLFCAQQTTAADTLFEKGRAAQVAGLNDEAEALYRAYLKQYQPNPQVLANLGVILARREDYTAAIELYQHALKLDPRLAPLHLNLGLAYMKRSQPTEAASQFEEFLKAQPGNRQATQLLGLALLDTEQYQRAEMCFRSLLPTEDVTINFGLATALTRQSKLAEARAVLEPALSHSNNAEVQLLLGQIQLQEGQVDEALKSLIEAQRLNPAVSHVRLWIGTVYWRQRQPDHAMAEWRSELNQHPNDFEVTYVLGCALSLNGTTRSEGISLLRNAVQLRPKNPRANYQLGKLIWQSEKNREALSYLENAITADPDFREAWFLHGTVLSALGRKTEAANDFAKVKQLSAKELARQQDLFSESQ